MAAAPRGARFGDGGFEDECRQHEGDRRNTGHELRVHCHLLSCVWRRVTATLLHSGATSGLTDFPARAPPAYPAEPASAYPGEVDTGSPTRICANELVAIRGVDAPERRDEPCPVAWQVGGERLGRERGGQA